MMPRLLEKLIALGSMAMLGWVLTSASRVLAEEEPCPKITTKTVDCPGKEDIPCPNAPIATGICSKELFEVKPGDFATQSNGNNETNTQTNGDEQDRVVCLEAYDCVRESAFNLKCKKGQRKPNDDVLVNPLEEIQCPQ